MPPKPKRLKAAPSAGFAPATYLESGAPPGRVRKFRRGAVVFSQGDAAGDVFYLREGVIKLTVLSRLGKEAAVGVLAPGDFFGEGVLAGQDVRLITASSSTC